MFCSGCGGQIDAALNYCNRCGNRVSKGDTSSVADNLSQAITYVGVFGLMGFIFVTVILIRKEVPYDAFVPIAIAYLSALVAICWMLIRHSFQLTKLKIEASRPTANVPDPNYLSPRTTAQLGEPTQQPASVIEHTTRTLDKIPVDR